MADSTKPELNEIASTADGKDITRGYLDPLEIMQSTDSVLQLRGGGDYKVYSEVLRDDQVAACFGQRRLAVVGKEWHVEAGGTGRKEKAAADYMKEQLQNVGWDRATGMMLYGVHYGFAVAEGMYARDGNTIALADIKVRDRRRFGFDGMGRLRMKTQANPKGELMPDRKFWAFSTGADHDDEPYGVGLGHWLYWPAFFKRNGLKYWLLFLEKFGQPTAKGTYGPNATPEEKKKLLQALAAISTDSGVSIPEGMIIELLEAKRSGTADYVSLYDRMDAAIAKVILGQTASTQGTPGKLGNDELQSDVRIDLIKADADLICESFNRGMGKWLTEWNFPGAVPPRVYRKVEPDEDTAKRADRDKKVFDMGFKPTLQYVQENYGDGWEEKPAIDNVPLAATGSPAAAPDPVAAAPAVESVQQTALNGAQIKSLSDVIAQVQTGELDRNRARALIEAGFPAIQPDQIERLLGGNASFAEFAAMVAPVDAPVPQQMLEQTRTTLAPATNVWINQIRELANSASNMEDLRDKLLTAYPDMSLEQYADALANATVAANLAGRDNVVSGTN
ncbi:DUF935 domain-containing protein [Rheinheimera maricola]|uniref:DUF935 domain-containing protein n=1 Tax=Rheinheimera maricola TaxID=2793282 RepID=A0ABS7X7M5_9GAMM|nr:DUF935 family protein [Rheinheimera maricola]MBZ9610797.1 DUF935 domain-containing protein [Rheinheimera maricola]